MKVVYLLIIYFVLFSFFIKYNLEDRVVSLGELRSYGSVIIASHDAAVIREDQLANGYIVFDEGEGLDNFRGSLMKNLNLNADLSPESNSIFYGSIQILGVFFVGDDKVPHDTAGNPIYPYDFSRNVTYRGMTMTVKEKLSGPSVIGLIQMSYNIDRHPTVYKVAVYRYLDKQL